jgi:HD-GYP domain-containing protein (c-di-GMP phosphodiesterase class II)
MQEHAAIGGECIRQIERRLANSKFLQLAREIALFHHERWDGKGYPHGISREQIPLSARIVSIADVYDALTSRRVYKDPWPHEQCVETIRNKAGKQFDAEIVEVFLGIEAKFREIRDQYVDSEKVKGTFTNLDSDVAFSGKRNKLEQTLTTEQEHALLQVLPPDGASDRNADPVKATSQ